MLQPNIHCKVFELVGFAPIFSRKVGFVVDFPLSKQRYTRKKDVYRKNKMGHPGLSFLVNLVEFFVFFLLSFDWF